MGIIRYDRTRFSVVVVCSDCGWSDVGVSNDAAWSLAADHEERAHPERREVRHAAYVRNSRSTSDEM